MANLYYSILEVLFSTHGVHLLTKTLHMYDIKTSEVKINLIYEIRLSSYISVEFLIKIVGLERFVCSYIKRLVT